MCKSCGQSTHQYEKDLPKGQKELLHWRTFNATSLGPKTPSGRECQPCYSTRRRFFEEELEELLTVRAATPEVETRFQELRKDKVSGTNKFVKEERIKATNYIVDEQKQFRQSYIEGGFYNLRKFCKINGIKGTKNEDLKKAISDHPRFKKFRVGIGDTGKEGVFWPGDPNPHMSDYRFKEGLEKNLRRQTVKKYGNDDAHADEDFGETLGIGEQDTDEEWGSFSRGEFGWSLELLLRAGGRAWGRADPEMHRNPQTILPRGATD